ncbi:MAG: sel1 repeat family protein [Magnetococcales bacterium]|nr:sel1 repeat family protein [Magnetococcales bacterium]
MSSLFDKLQEAEKACPARENTATGGGEPGFLLSRPKMAPPAAARSGGRSAVRMGWAVAVALLLIIGIYRIMPWDRIAMLSHNPSPPPTEGAPAALHSLAAMAREVPSPAESEAVAAVRTAAMLGDSAAQMMLGKMFHEGNGGVLQSDAKAALWYLMAAEQGNGQAQLILGLMSLRGQGVPRDAVESYKWLHIAAAQGNPEAGKNRDKVARHLTPEQLTRAQARVRNWQPQQRLVAPPP